MTRLHGNNVNENLDVRYEFSIGYLLAKCFLFFSHTESINARHTHTRLFYRSSFESLFFFVAQNFIRPGKIIENAPRVCVFTYTFFITCIYCRKVIHCFFLFLCMLFLKKSSRKGR